VEAVMAVPSKSRADMPAVVNKANIERRYFIIVKEW